jgi:hypothetical protein
VRGQRRNSSRNPPKGAIDRGTEIINMGDASRDSMRLGNYKKEGLIQGGNRVYKGSRTLGFLSFLSWPSFPLIQYNILCSQSHKYDM